MQKEFYGSVHCHTDRSNFRLRDCINRLDELCWYAADELKHNFIAITDHETINTAIDCEKVEAQIREKYPDFKIVRGNEIYLCRNGLNAENFDKEQDKYWHFILLAADAEGHHQIREISTRAWLRSYMARGMLRVPTYYQDIIDVIGSNPGHVICSTACLGSFYDGCLLKYMKSGDEADYEYAKSWFLRMAEIVGEKNLFLETQPSFNKEQIFVNQQIKRMSEEIGFPVIITLDAHYLKKEDFNIHKAFLNAQEGDRETESFYASTYMMSREEIHSYMDETVGRETVSRWLNNSKKIYDRCKDYSLQKPTRIVYLPKTIDTISEKEFLDFKYKIQELEYFYTSPHQENRDLAAAIVRKIINKTEEFNNKKTFEMIDDNLKAIRLASEKMNTQWSAYLLNLRDYCKIIWEKGNSLMGCARGSGTGFLLLYMLDVTQINPLREKTKTYSFRFLNPERVSPLDVDCDIEGMKRPQVYKALQEAYGYDRVSKVLTIRTEKAKSGILTAMRGLGYDPDEAQYVASFIQADRGQQRTLSQTFYGDEENGIAPDTKFQELMTNKYSDVWEVAQKIEGLCNGVGSHAGGVVFYDEPITNSTAQMKTTNGDIITQFDLHTIESVGSLKIDLLSIEALDRIRACLDLLVKKGYIDGKDKTLRQIYEEAIGVYNIEREEPKMWQLLNGHKIQSLFQMEQQSGIKGIEAVKPTSVDDLAALNAVIRLMVSEKGAEQPTDKFARFKRDIQNWYQELKEWKVDEKYWPLLEETIGLTYGMCIQQEQFMILVQRPECGGFSLLWADRLRKSIAKKNPKEYEQLTKEFFEQTEQKGCDKNLCKYVWQNLIALNRGYGFNAAHTLAYSLVALQEMNLAYKYPIIFWNTANLIVDSGSMGLEEELKQNDNEEKIENSSTDYGKMATAIGKMKMNHINFTLPNINQSDITYSPDINNDTIICGLRGLTRIGNQLINDIIKNRPYTSISNFLNKIKINKIQMINLIKAGTFDALYNNDRIAAMNEYLALIADKKKRITLQNMQMLIEKDLIPEELVFEKKLFNFNKYIRKFKTGSNYKLDSVAMDFYLEHYEDSVLQNIEVNGNEQIALIDQALWDRTYKIEMEIVKIWMKDNQEQILNELNNCLLKEAAEKYTEGNISKWEMDSLSFYYHEHELAKLKYNAYGIVDYNVLPTEPRIEKTFETKDGTEISIYEISRIAGTVIDKDKNKSQITLLTPTGVVVVKVWKSQFSSWDKQISEKDSDGTKHVLEKSWFTKGTKLIITGMRRGDTFIPKKYKSTEWPLFERIDELDGNGYIVKSTTERIEIDE